MTTTPVKSDGCRTRALHQSRIVRCWQALVAFLRHWSGDDAYERYLAEHQGHKHVLLSKREFYKRYIDKRGSGGRCC